MLMFLIHRMSILFCGDFVFTYNQYLNYTGELNILQNQNGLLYCQKPIDEGNYSVWNMMNETE